MSSASSDLRLISEMPMRRAMSVQPSATRSSVVFWPNSTAAKFSRRARCQPGSRLRYHSSSVGMLPRRSTEDGVLWKT